MLRVGQRKGLDSFSPVHFCSRIMRRLSEGEPDLPHEPKNADTFDTIEAQQCTLHHTPDMIREISSRVSQLSTGGHRNYDIGHWRMACRFRSPP
jgi:hypothetical protein